jgi:hypothetical protein
MLYETMRTMQEADAEYADCWTHAVCAWNDGPEFWFGGSWGGTAPLFASVVAKAYLPESPAP